MTEPRTLRELVEAIRDECRRRWETMGGEKFTQAANAYGWVGNHLDEALSAEQPQDAREAQIAVFRTLVEEALSYCLAQQSSDWTGWIENAKEALMPSTPETWQSSPER